MRLRGKLVGNKVVPYPARAELSAVGSLAGQGTALGRRSGRGLLPRRCRVRAGCSSPTPAKPCASPMPTRTAILISRSAASWWSKGELTMDQASAQGIKAWLAANPKRQQELLNANPSYVFFKEEKLTDPTQGPEGRAGRAADAAAFGRGRPELHSARRAGIPVDHAAGQQCAAAAPDGGAGYRRRDQSAVQGRFLLGLWHGSRRKAGQMKQRGMLWVLLPKLGPGQELSADQARGARHAKGLASGCCFVRSSYNAPAIRQTSGETSMEYENIIVETQGKVGVIRLNRPKALNALNDQLMDELGAALLDFDNDDKIGCIVLTGSEKAFAAGADIGAMANYSYMDVYKGEYITRNWETIRRVRKPVIAAVAGYRAGRWLRAGDDVRFHHRRRYREIRAARNQARHHAGGRRHPAPAARHFQIQGHGHVPDRAHDGCRRSRACRPGFARRCGRQADGRSAWPPPLRSRPCRCRLS